MSNLARFVVIIWCFVVLILTQSYTASLTSLLTVQQLQPTVTDVNLLLKYKDNVAYQPGSFVHGILKELGFQDENLKTFNTPEELNQLFQNGSRKNGISAAFDETPYMKLFLATYCSKYTLVDPTFKADGFAFVSSPAFSPLCLSLMLIHHVFSSGIVLFPLILQLAGLPKRLPSCSRRFEGNLKCERGKPNESH